MDCTDLVQRSCGGGARSGARSGAAAVGVLQRSRSSSSRTAAVCVDVVINRLSNMC
jgi:hypothetical protein